MECLWIGFGLAALILIGTLWDRFRTRRIAAARGGENFDTFRASFGADEVPEVVLLGVYAKFQEWSGGSGVPDFPVRAEDNIVSIYGMADEDFEEIVIELVAVCGRKLPPDKELRSMRPIITVRDVALFVAACPTCD